jgi:diketogulonate reductase-like aldo/keto reductase
MESIYESGRAKAIGLSNFMIEHLEDLLPECKVPPTVNQVEFHPFLLQPHLLKFCREHHIQLEAWSPIAQGQVVSVPELQRLAEKYQKTPVQIVLRWELQHEVVTIPKSVHRERIAENAQVFDFELSDDDMAEIDALDENRRIGPDPYTFTF